jgi:hypothetical protein
VNVDGCHIHIAVQKLDFLAMMAADLKEEVKHQGHWCCGPDKEKQQPR